MERQVLRLIYTECKQRNRRKTIPLQLIKLDFSICIKLLTHAVRNVVFGEDNVEGMLIYTINKLWCYQIVKANQGNNITNKFIEKNT